MERNKLIYISLLLVCIALIFYAVHLFSLRADLDQPMHSVFVKQGNAYVMSLDITNTESVNRNFTISVLVDGKKYNENILLGAGRIFTYEHYIYPPLQDNRINVAVYKENEPAPVSENTYTIGVV